MALSRINDVFSRLTIEEKISLLAGGSAWATQSIPEKGVPSVKLSDGPNGARGVSTDHGATSACLPAACSVASTFDVNLSRRIGLALGEETLTKGARCLLGPTVCIHRHPLGGRNFESFSEDPFLNGKMAAANILGMQSTGVSATIKHFVANEQETRRLVVNSKVSERALREIYLKPFEIAIKEAKPWAVMTSYNKINGHHAESNDFLLRKVLRGEWGWEGLVMSDWGGTNSTAEAINAGMDLEMPGPSKWRRQEDVLAALRNGSISEKTIDERAHRVLAFLEQLDCFENPGEEYPEEHSIDKPEHRALIREAGAKGVVLLKNQDGMLPLTREKVRGKKIAMFGYAKDCLAHGGGSASVRPHYRVTPWDALHEAFKDNDVQFEFSKGAHTFRQLPVMSEAVTDLHGNPGFTFSVFEKGAQTPFEISHGHPDSEVSLLRGQNLENRDVALTGTYHSPETSKHYFTLSGLGPSQLIIDDKVIFDQAENCSDAMGFLFGGVPLTMVEFEMEKGRDYQIKITSKSPLSVDSQNLGFLANQVGVRLGSMSAIEHDRDILSEAVELAKTSDYALVFTGNDPSWETEGQDQAGFNLPKNGSQDRLVSAVAAVNPRTVVINSTGVAVALPWLDQVQGLLQTWLPGQEAGHSIADVLTGVQNPEGHLTCSFPKRLEDCPAYGNFPGGYNDNGEPEVEYKEGIFVGYRHFDRLAPDTVHFPFGFGLSYTNFEFGNLSVETTSSDLYATKVTVSNVGSVKGAIAVQVYVGRKTHYPQHPIKALVGFEKVTLEPRESRNVNIHVRARDFAFWDEDSNGWVIEGGTYNFSVAKSAGELVATREVQIGPMSFMA